MAHLDDDLPLERLLGGEEDARHAAASQLPLDGVGTSQSFLQGTAHVVGH